MASATIGNLNVKLGIDTAQFSTGVKAAQSSLAGLTSSLKTFAAGAVGALSLGAVASTLKNAANRMDELGKAAQKMGIPVEELSKLEYAARLADVGLGELQGSVARLSKGLAEMQQSGKGGVAEALQALNIAAVDAQGKLRPTGDIMADLAAKFAVMQDGAGKTAIAMALFGKSGADLIPLLNGGREAIQGAGDELERFGGVVSEQAAVAAEQFNDNLTRLQTAGEGATQQIAQALLPAAVDLTEAFLAFLNTGTPVVDMVESLKDWFAELAPFIEATRKEIEMLTDAYKTLRGLFGNGDAALPKLQSDFDALWGGGKQTPADGKGSLPSARRTQEAPVMPSIGGSGGRSSTGKSKITPINGYDIRGAGLEVDELTESLYQAEEASYDLAGALSNTIGDAVAGLASGTMSLTDAFSNFADSLLADLADISSALLKSGLMKLLGGLGTSFGGAMGLGGFGGFYAQGGTLGAGKWGIAGENGPEIVQGPAGITPVSNLMGGGTTINVINQGGGQVEQRKRRGSDGREIIDIIVGVARQEQARGAKRLLGGGFGLSPQLTQR
jgi:hypothetical protein